MMKRLKDLKRVIKYVLLIPVRMLFLPRIYRRLVKVEEALAELKDLRWGIADLNARIQPIEGSQKDLRWGITDLNARIQPGEELVKRAREEYFIAETMLKSLEANIRESKLERDEILARMKALEELKTLGKENLSQAQLMATSLESAVRGLVRDVNMLKGAKHA